MFDFRRATVFLFGTLLLKAQNDYIWCNFGWCMTPGCDYVERPNRPWRNKGGGQGGTPAPGRSVLGAPN